MSPFFLAISLLSFDAAAPEPVAARAAPSDDEAAPLAPKPRRRRTIRTPAVEASAE